MQIHELNNYNGNLDSGAYLALDNGTDTGRISAARFLEGTQDAIDALETDLNNRIDNIIAGGTAPSEAEVTDARYGADGVTYASLGDAIRSQITNVQDQIDDLDDLTNASLNAGLTPITILKGKGIGSTGVITNQAHRNLIIIDVDNDGYYFAHNINKYQIGYYHGFDSNGDLVAGGVSANTSNTEYVGFVKRTNSNVVKIMFDTWEPGYTWNGHVCYGEHYVTHIAEVAPVINGNNVIMENSYPFIFNLYNPIYNLNSFFYKSSSSTFAINAALFAYGFLPVEESDIISFDIDTTNNYSLFAEFACFFDSSFAFLSSSRYADSITVPAGAKYAVFVFYVTDASKIEITKYISDPPDMKVDARAIIASTSEDPRAYPLFINIANEVAEITYKYDASTDYTIQMQKQGGLDADDNPTGGNQLFDFCRWFKTSNTSPIVTNAPNVSSYYKINGTDFLGPFRIRALTNIDGDTPNSNDWTGGNHQYNNQGSGSTATARTANIKFKVDGRFVSSFNGYAREIVLSWDNYIQANNTKKSDGTGREVLKEHYEVRFDGDKFYVRNVIEALEDICIYTYYGMQAKQLYNQGGAIDNYFLYAGSKVNRTWQPRSTATTSGDKNCRDIIYQRSPDRLEMHIDYEGLGDFADSITNPHNDEPCSALSSTGKLYFNLIDYGTTYDGSGLILNGGDTVFWEGYYKFDSIA